MRDQTSFAQRYGYRARDQYGFSGRALFVLFGWFIAIPGLLLALGGLLSPDGSAFLAFDGLVLLFSGLAVCSCSRRSAWMRRMLPWLGI